MEFESYVERFCRDFDMLETNDKGRSSILRHRFDMSGPDVLDRPRPEAGGRNGIRRLIGQPDREEPKHQKVIVPKPEVLVNDKHGTRGQPE